MANLTKALVTITTNEKPEGFIVLLSTLFDLEHEIGMSDSSNFEYYAPRFESSRLLRLNLIERINSKHFKCDKSNQHMLSNCMRKFVCKSLQCRPTWYPNSTCNEIECNETSEVLENYTNLIRKVNSKRKNEMENEENVG